MNRFSPLLLGLCLLLSAPAESEEGPSLSITSWGGAYEAAQRAAYMMPFEQATGVAIDLRPYNGGLEALRRQIESGVVEFDVLDMTEPDALAACEEGLLAPFDPGILAAPPDGGVLADDLMPGALSDCGIAHLTYATVIAFDDRAFPGVKPRSVADFFDIERFPGKRALRKTPIGNLEWALMAYGVPLAQVYDLLSTERGLRLAFRKLDEIRDHIVWWESGAEAPQLLQSGEVTMASGYNGRFFDARVLEGAPITILWEGQLLDVDVWAIAKNSDKRELAEDFIAFATRAESMSALANRIPYGPQRRSALQRIGLHPEANLPMLPHLPTAPRHLARAIRTDSDWYAHTDDLRERQFKAWLEAKPEVADSR